jgi:teichoic acid transport system permease protein
MTAVGRPSREVTVYRSTKSGMPELGPYWRGITNRGLFMWHMARTDLKARHYDTALGQLWIILDPLLMAAVYFFLRTVVRPVGGQNRNFVIDHIIWGVFFFSFTASSLRAGAQSIVSNKPMVLNTAFPRAIFPIVAVLTALLDFLPTLFVFFIVHAVLGMPFGTGFAMLPLIILLQTIFNLGVAMLWAPAVVFYRDVGGLLPYVSQIWIYATPVLYSTAEIPANLKPFLRLNPLYPFWSALEQIFGGRWPSPVYLLAAASWAVATFALGLIPFLRRERDFAIRL